MTPRFSPKPARVPSSTARPAASLSPPRAHAAPPDAAPPPTTELASIPAPATELRSVERQLSALFGESLFGSWPELESALRQRGRLRTRRVWLWRIVVVAAAVSLAFGVRELLRPALVHKSNEDRSHYARQLGIFLEDGALRNAANLTELVRGSTRQLDAGDAHFDLLLRADAALYRYFDADPERLARLVPHLQAPKGAQRSASHRMAQLTLLSRSERAEHLPELEKLAQQLSRDAEVHYLLATAREQRGDLDGARRAWRRSEDCGPAWLPHRFEQAVFEKRREDAAAAARIAAEMNAADPDSLWSEAAARLFPLTDPAVGAVSPVGAASVRAADTVAPASPNDPAAAPGSLASPVQIYRTGLILAIEQAKRGETAAAQRSLVEAVGAVRGGAPFVIDAFDELLEAGALELAQSLTRRPEWPVEGPIGAAKAAELRKALETR